MAWTYQLTFALNFYVNALRLIATPLTSGFILTYYLSFGDHYVSTRLQRHRSADKDLMLKRGSDYKLAKEIILSGGLVSLGFRSISGLIWSVRSRQ
jgi:hypothetical protein